MFWKNFKKLGEVITWKELVWGGVIIMELVILFYLKQSIGEKTAIVEKENLSVQSQTKLLDQYNQLLKEKEEADKLRPLLENILADKDDLLGLAREFSAMAKQTGVEVVPAFTGETESQPGLFDYSYLTLTADGEYTQILNFLKLLNQSRFLFKINDFNLSRLNDTEDFRFFARGQIMHRK